MPGEDQERFEDYLDLERFISELQAGQVAHPPHELTPAQARIYLMATQFHAATPGASEPLPEFVEQLQGQLEEELEALMDTQQLPKIQAGRSRPKKRLSRRMLLTGSATAAASVVVGAVTDHMVEQTLRHPTPASTLASVVPTKWFSVYDVTKLGTQAVRFVTEQMVGYVLRCGDDAPDPADRGQIIAVSAACTHMGCIVQWNKEERRFHCPCHGGIFLEDGGVDSFMSPLYLSSLPRLDVRIEQGKVLVKMPSAPSTPPNSYQDQDQPGPMKSKDHGW